MKEENYLQLQKEFYLQELEARDKISSRLNIPMVLLVSIASFLAYVVRNIDISAEDVSGRVTVLIVVSAIVSISTFLVATFFFLRALGGVKGHLYLFIPKAEEVENYRNKLKTHYQEYGEDSYKEYFDEFLLCAYAEYASKNAIVNDARSKSLHHCSAFLTYSILPMATLFLAFTFSGFNGEKSKNNNSVVIQVAPYYGATIKTQPLRMPTTKDNLNVQ